MNKIMLITALLLSIFLVIGTASAYICINPQTDSQEVQKFKVRLNDLSIKSDINKGLSEQAILTKIKYFNPCK